MVCGRSVAHAARVDEARVCNGLLVPRCGPISQALRILILHGVGKRPHRGPLLKASGPVRAQVLGLLPVGLLHRSRHGLRLLPERRDQGPGATVGIPVARTPGV